MFHFLKSDMKTHSALVLWIYPYGVVVVRGCCKLTNVGDGKIGGRLKTSFFFGNFSASLPNQI